MPQYLIKPMGNKATHNSQWRNTALKYKSKHVKKQGKSEYSKSIKLYGMTTNLFILTLEKYLYQLKDNMWVV